MNSCVSTPKEIKRGLSLPLCHIKMDALNIKITQPLLCSMHPHNSLTNLVSTLHDTVHKSHKSIFMPKWFNPSDPDRFLLHLCPEGVLNLTPPINSSSFPFFTIKGMECISHL